MPLVVCLVWAERVGDTLQSGLTEPGELTQGQLVQLQALELHSW